MRGPDDPAENVRLLQYETTGNIFYNLTVVYSLKHSCTYEFSERGYHNMSRSASFKYGITSTRLSRYNSDFHKHYHYRNVNLSKELCKTRCNDLLKHANINEIHHIRHK